MKGICEDKYMECFTQDITSIQVTKQVRWLKGRFMDTTLIIMAAGIGSRYGAGIKQLAKMGPNGEIIMDYSIRDAKEAGFNKVVFIIRKDIFEEFEEIIGSRIKDQIDVEYVFQE